MADFEVGRDIKLQLIIEEEGIFVTLPLPTYVSNTRRFDENHDLETRTNAFINKLVYCNLRCVFLLIHNNQVKFQYQPCLE